jgi:mycofactocin system glycosyltransferase
MNGELNVLTGTTTTLSHFEKVDSAEFQQLSSPQQTVSYTLQAELQLIRSGNGGLLLALRPLMAMRFSTKGFAILSCLNAKVTAAEVAVQVPGLTATEITTFLDKLAERRLVIRDPSPPAEWPMVSVIVPAHGRPTMTRACIESLLALDYPASRLEVIVVDDASEPPLDQALTNLPVRLLRQDRNIGQSAARNLAAAQAKGDLLAFIDNDCVAATDWLKALVSHFDRANVGIIGGRVLAPVPDSPVAAFEAVRSPLDMGPVESQVGPGEWVSYLPTCNLLVRRDLLLRNGGFDPKMRLGEDVDFIWRALSGGARVCYRPAGQIVHYHRVQLWDLLCRRADYGSSEADLQQRHPTGWRTMPLPVVSIILIVALTTSTVSGLAAILLCVLALSFAGIEYANKRRGLRRLGANVSPRLVFTAVCREHFASLYYFSANTTRYYSLPLLISCVLWPHLLPSAIVVMLVAPISDHQRLQPRLSLLTYTGLFCLEMAAYQLGVWRGCLQQQTLRPLLPRVRWHW